MPSALTSPAFDWVSRINAAHVAHSVEDVLLSNQRDRCRCINMPGPRPTLSVCLVVFLWLAVGARAGPKRMDLQHRAGYRALSLGYDQDHLKWEVVMYGFFAGVISRF